MKSCESKGASILAGLRLPGTRLHHGINTWALGSMQRGDLSLLKAVLWVLEKRRRFLKATLLYPHVEIDFSSF